jgi:glycosyltransferase involved in cell wall biosynthesis
VLQSLPHVQFVLAGDGKDRPKFVQLAADLGISSHVCFTGNVVDPMAEGVYLAADVVCQVSRVNESFGWAVAEAMAFSRPVIGTRAGALPEVISDGVSGFIVERRDAAAIADRILLLLRDAALRREMGRAGREIAEQRFDLRKNVARLLQVYGVSR